MRAAIYLIITVLTFALSQTASPQKTTRGRLKVKQTASTPIAYDTIAVAADSAAFTFSGYEKTLRSSKESFFATNNTDSTVSHIVVKIEYKDMSGRSLDCRVVRAVADMPPASTRKIDIPTWDGQRVFYYYRSPVPRTAQATPYKVSITLEAALRKH